jgi:hypothetical protein
MRATLTKDPDRWSAVRVGACVVLTRLALALVGYYAFHFGRPTLHLDARRFFVDDDAIAVFLRWDVWWYLSIVDGGYSFKSTAGSNVAFLPGFPIAVALVKTVVGSSVVAGLVVANASFVASVVALYGWVRERVGVIEAERAAVLLCVYPLSFFFNTVYAESFYFLLCTLALRSADRGSWWPAMIWASLATLTRPMGIFLVPAFACVLWRKRKLVPRQVAFGLALPVVSLAFHAAYLWQSFGSPFVLLKAHRVGWNVGAFGSLFQLAPRANAIMAIFDAFQAALPFGLVLATVVLFRRIGPMTGVYAALSSAIGILLGPESIGREALAVVPALVVAGMSSASRPVRWAVCVLGFGLFASFSYAFAMGRFMG